MTEEAKKFLEGIVFKHRIEAVCRETPSIYRFYDSINGWHSVYFVEDGDGTRHMEKVNKCRCTCI